MRYLVAMAGAILLALAATLLVSVPIANFAVDRLTFDNPDDVADLHTAVFMGCNAVALLVGWVIGWFVGGAIIKPPAPPA